MAVLDSIVDGTVVSIMPFGIFVDIGGGESGLVHISELSSSYVKDINEFVKKGDKVKAKVMRIEDGKISLSMKRAEAKPERRNKEKPRRVSARPDSYDWTARSTEEMSFEDRLSKFKHESEEKIRDSKRRMENRGSGGYSRRGY